MANANLITLTDPQSNAAEAFRTLRTNLMFSSVERPIQTLLVTSPAQDDNKSITLANLAVTFAQSGNKTILVDANLRQPAQHSIWNVSGKGLSQMMLEDSLLSNPPLQESGVPNLQILTAGEQAPNPADLLSSKRMADIIGILKARATYVLFDAPSVLSSTDATILGVKLDGVLLVIRSGKTRRDDVDRARVALERVNARIVGAVMTNASKNN
jgi:capsular exopolysaccharide synthesis family protein